MIPSSSTTATFWPTGSPPPSSTDMSTHTVRKKRPITPTLTPSAMKTVRRREPMGLLLLLLVVLAAAAPPLPSPELLDLPAPDRRGPLLQAETDPPLRRVHPDDHERQLIPHVHDILGAAHRPVGHLRDVQQPVDPRLQLHEGPEVGAAHDLPRHARPHRVALGHHLPRVRLDLLHAERDALGGPV